MKKIILIVLSTLVAVSVIGYSYHQTSIARAVFSDAVLEEMKADVDLKDYNIDPVKMTECVVDLAEMKMSGTRLDIVRKGEYEAYATLLTFERGRKVDTVVNELSEAFGSWQEAAMGHTNYSTSIYYCIERVAPHNAHVVQEDDAWAQKIAFNVRAWWGGLWS